MPANAYAGAQERRSRPISRVLSWTIIPLGHPSPDASGSLPGSHARTPRCRLPCDFPIWPCSRRGLPCHGCCHPRGALLPHHFTLACDPSPERELAHRRYLSVALSVGSRPPGVTWRRIRRSPDFPLHLVRNTAIVWPTPEATIPPNDLNHKRDIAPSPEKAIPRSRPVSVARPRARLLGRRPHRGWHHSRQLRWLPLSRPAGGAKRRARCVP